MKKIFNCITVSLCLFSQINLAFAKNNKSTGQYDIRNLALPSDVKDVEKHSGSIFYSSSVKGKVLMPVHVWGEVKHSGLHFIPIDTKLASGLSIAGGPSAHAKLREVKLIRRIGKDISSQSYDLSEGGTESAYETSLKPGDSIFVARDRYYENRAYYTSLTSVALTILSSILLYKEVKKN